MAGPSSEAGSSDFRTILAAVQEYAAHDALSSSQPLHPYSSNPELTLGMLRNLINTTSDIASSLNAQVTMPWSNPKLLSLLRQQTAISHTVHNVSHVSLFCKTFLTFYRLIKPFAKLWTSCASA